MDVREAITIPYQADIFRSVIILTQTCHEKPPIL